MCFGRVLSWNNRAQYVVEVLSGFVVSAHGANAKVELPLPRTAAVAAVEEMVDAGHATEGNRLSRAGRL